MPSSASRSGLQDRRGYDLPLKLNLVALVVSLLLLFVYNWKIGLALLVTSCCSFVTLEAISAPPLNGPRTFLPWLRRSGARKPILVCLGDSLTHGNCSAPYTPEIPFAMAKTLGMAPPKQKIFTDPVWVVNCGQNCITSYTILNERLNAALGCHPDYIFIMIGTNDIRAVYKSRWSHQVTRVNELPEAPSLDGLERNLEGILNFCRQSSPLVQIGVATLPPMGEDLTSNANQVVRDANIRIAKVVSRFGERCSLLNVYEGLEAILEKKRRRWNWPVDWFFPAALIMNPLIHCSFGLFSWNFVSALVGNTVLSDGLHLNERGRDVVVDAIVDWLSQKNIAKAIAVKS